MPNSAFWLLLGLAVVAFFAVLVMPRSGLLARWQRLRSMTTRVQGEDVLKHLYTLELAGHAATIQSVAGALQISVNRAAAVLTELAKAELVTLADDTLQLTPAGRETARHVLRAHRLWESRLADETGVPEGEWHAQAEQYEHTLLPHELDELAARLGNPTHDPHGDPIPSAEGAMAANGGKPLTELDVGQAARITHLEDEPEAVYAQLVAEGFYPGMQVKLLERTPQRVRVWADGDEHLLAPIVAANVTVAPLPRHEPMLYTRGRSLATLKPGQAARVVRLSPRCRGPERRRLMDLGLLPGTWVRAELASPAGDPIAYRIRGALIALRREQANWIEISDVQEAT